MNMEWINTADWNRPGLEFGKSLVTCDGKNITKIRVLSASLKNENSAAKAAEKNAQRVAGIDGWSDTTAKDHLHSKDQGDCSAKRQGATRVHQRSRQAQTAQKAISRKSRKSCEVEPATLEVSGTENTAVESGKHTE